ncbi:Uncharacterized protein dnl_26360 [Desulfonema limicola]|uniref:Uncharacterized protein n=1 Tax=Desulfonema limicola TaxID=45656 RepID=A0A975GGL1_9BACT|nr:hypothetical protein [Desulfonema limicola]QTA80337.1 Uncharacterized protein dnl_26360 [Desulfonema limicola]
MQIQGGDAKDAAFLAGLTKDIKTGGIHAETLYAKNTVTGLQFIADPKNATKDDLVKEVAAFQENIEKAVNSGEITDTKDAEEINHALVSVEKELAEPKSKGSRIIRSLKNVTELLNETAETLKAGGKVQAQIIKLAPTAAAICAAASVLFGV